MTKARNAHYHLAVVLLLIAVSSAACGGDKRGEDAVPELTADEILNRASARLAETSSMRFTLSVDGESYIDNARTIQLREARGDLVRPDRVRTDFIITVLRGVTISTSLIIIGDQTWSTDLITGAWGPAPLEFGYDPSILFDNQGGIGPVMDRVVGAVRLDDESVRDRAAYHLRATVANDVIGPLTMETMTGTPVTVDLWIARDNFDLLRARLAEPPRPDRAAATWTLDLSAHGADFKIEPPV